MSDTDDQGTAPTGDEIAQAILACLGDFRPKKEQMCLPKSMQILLRDTLEQKLEIVSHFSPAQGPTESTTYVDETAPIDIESFAKALEALKNFRIDIPLSPLGPFGSALLFSEIAQAREEEERQIRQEISDREDARRWAMSGLDHMQACSALSVNDLARLRDLLPEREEEEQLEQDLAQMWSHGLPQLPYTAHCIAHKESAKHRRANQRKRRKHRAAFRRRKRRLA